MSDKMPYSWVPRAMLRNQIVIAFNGVAIGLLLCAEGGALANGEPFLTFNNITRPLIAAASGFLIYVLITLNGQNMIRYVDALLRKFGALRGGEINP